ncbi:MAG: Hpt domain-containing protein, partial [Pseudomonadota bacterium]|nr:Hpt domain-containing protein [Pseudomonadota bacterium]
LPVNLARLRSYTEGDLEEEKMFFNIFIEQARQTLDTLEQTLQDHNLEDWCRAAHKLKGSSANIGAEQLAELCQIAEFHDKTITEEDILKAIRTELNKVDEFLNTLTDKAVKAHLSDESKRMH